ncbi:glycosyltransferase [Chitinophaga agrisoli]|uniref:Glycosyltransferase n=1 Tax=Chitinophaga agrisoli TaxID=2607653 RepID=A0A5B2VHT2_9BACT|nr:glycosyltransferase [Chitinophaga agrisoli]KAA2239143.1 glycosyltransferase [Chitinophaga agrisoli]
MSPVVSIILPTYNGARFIRQSLDSCLAQTFRDIELIIVNDCSTDETPAIIKEYAQRDPRIKVINNATNQRLPASLNIGFSAASGRYYTWTSDDNYYAPDAIAKMVAVLEQQPDIDLVYADYYEVDNDDKITGYRHFKDINDSVAMWDGCGACFLYKAAVHTRNKGYAVSTFLIEDYDFFLRASLHSKFYHLNNHELYYYRYHPASLTGTMASAVMDIQKIVVERQLPLLMQHISERDQMLFYRKYAVYYALYKNNTGKVKYYLEKLYAMSKAQVFVTVGYVIVMKTAQLFKVSFAIVMNLLQLLFTPKKQTKG